MTSLKFPIETQRLYLRPFHIDDVKAVHAYHGLDEVARYQYWPPRSLDEVAVKVPEWAEMNGLGPQRDSMTLVVERKEEPGAIGDVFLAVRDRAARQGEIGFSFHPRFQGQGYASEAVRALLELGFDTYGLHRIFGGCDVRNKGSWRLMERVGMRREAHFREHALFKGGWDEEFVYAILEDEWRAHRGVPGS